MTSPAQAATAITHSGAPLLVLDTCSLLDLAREPTREKFSGDHAAAAVDLLRRAEANELSVVIAQQSRDELLAHLDPTIASGELAVSKLEAQVQKLLAILRAYEVQPPLFESLSGLGYGASARSVIERYLAVATIVDSDAGAVTRAFERVQQAIAPATPSKQSMKDCVIIETSMETVRLTRPDFQGRAVFQSSNTTDYCDPAQPSLLAPALAGDFGPLGMDYAKTFLEAKYTLFPAGL